MVWSQTAESGEALSICGPGVGGVRREEREQSCTSGRLIWGQCSMYLKIQKAQKCLAVLPVCRTGREFPSFLPWIPQTPSAKWVLSFALFYG